MGEKGEGSGGEGGGKWGKGRGNWEWGTPCPPPHVWAISIQQFMHRNRTMYFEKAICDFDQINQGLSIQRDRKHCINVADNKNYLACTVPYL